VAKEIAVKIEKIIVLNETDLLPIITLY